MFAVAGCGEKMLHRPLLHLRPIRFDDPIRLTINGLARRFEPLSGSSPVPRRFEVQLAGALQIWLKRA